jgi:predicted dehydrogenase
MTGATVERSPQAKSEPSPGSRERHPRLAFVGVGWIGRSRMEALVRSGSGDVAAIVDPLPQMASDARLLAPQAAVFTSIEDALHQGYDGIVIATPSALHAEQAVRAMEAGHAVFCQKPLGRNHQETARVIDTAKRNDVLLGVDFSYRYLDAIAAMRPHIAEIGDIYAVNAVFHNAYGPDKAWFYDASLSGGGCLMDLGIHLVDMVLWLLEYPSITAVNGSLLRKGLPVRDRDDVEDYASALLTLDNRTNVSLACSWGLPLGCDAFIEVSLFGTEGGVSLRNVNGSFYDFAAHRYRGTRCELLHQPPDDWGGKALVAWADELARDNRYSPAMDSVVQVASVIDAIYSA